MRNGAIFLLSIVAYNAEIGKGYFCGGRKFPLDIHAASGRILSASEVIRMTVREAARQAETSVRALRYYEEMGLIRPKRSPANDYRDYDAETVARIRLIRAYRELRFSLGQIGRLLDAPRMERDAMLEAQIQQLECQKQVLENRIDLARSLRMIGPEQFAEIDFAAVDTQMAQMRQTVTDNADLKALSERYQKESEEKLNAVMETLVRRLAAVATAPDPDVPAEIDRLRAFITDNFYPCTDAILLYYARSFGGDGLLAQTLEEIAGPDAASKLRARIEKQIGLPSSPICPK